MTRQEQGFKFRIITNKLTMWGRTEFPEANTILYASTYRSAQSMAKFYGLNSKIEKL